MEAKSAIGPMDADSSCFVIRTISGARTLAKGIAIKIDDNYCSRISQDAIVQIYSGQTFGIKNCGTETAVVEIVEFRDLSDSTAAATTSV